MYTSFKIVLYTPNEETTYQSVIPLNFTLRWTYDLIPLKGFDLKADYAYKIDNNPFVSILPNKSQNDQYASGTSFVVNPSFFNSINISNLTDGFHELVIKASFYYGKNLLLNDSSTPFIFESQKSTPSLAPSNTTYPTPTIPEFNTFLLLLFLTAILTGEIIRKGFFFQRINKRH